MAYREFDKSQTLPQIEEEVLNFWEKRDTFMKSVARRADAPRYVFYEGPPTANGHPGAHHVLARTIKDIVCRYKTMRGFLVERKAGWDTHGLPVEIEVEKSLAIDGKEDIEEYGIDAFTKSCRASVFKYKDEWDRLTRRMAYWIDLSDPYITCTNEYIESVWHILKGMWDRGLIYKGHKILPYCPRCGTPLSSHEVAQGYRDAEDPSVFVRMRAKDEPKTSYLVWTTTPWTLISNVALAVAPDETYVKVSTDDELLILAEARLSVLNEDYEVVATYKGSELVGHEYEPLFDFVRTDKKAWYVIGADFVTLDEGTGIVHTAPAFGEDDYRVGVEHDLPFIQPVDGQGRFTAEVAPWAGMFIKDADPLIEKDLEKRGLMYESDTLVHTYPFCWRCDSPLVYYARDSWYLRTTDFKDEMLANNREIDWHPREVGLNRLGDWLENNVDWAISRDRYWGTPLNVWICEGCGQRTSVGSIRELKEKSVGELDTAALDLHKPWIDGVRLKCDGCGGEMRRTPEVIDCWFDTGSMPYAQWHYPFEGEEEFEAHFPADFIAEGVDQTRGWFYSLLAISTIVSGRSSFKRCVVNDMVLDAAGKKMSKSVGNVADSFEVMATQGADALRWYMMSTSPPWVPTKFDEEGVKDVASKLFDTLRNTYSFFSLYANIDGYDPAKHVASGDSLRVIDRWILSRLHSTLLSVEADMESYDITKAVRKLQYFVLEDVSNWYVRLSRSRFWKGEMDDDKKAAYSTLHEVLERSVQAIAPFAPLLSDAIYRRLAEGGGDGFEESVHLCDYPAPDEAALDRDLEAAMSLARSIVVLGRAARQSSGLKVRQPLGRLLVAGVPEEERGRAERLRGLVLSELNVKELEWAEPEALAAKKAVPVFPALGPKHGKDVNQVAEAIRALPESDVEALAAGRNVRVSVSDTDAVIEPSDVRIDVEAREGLAVQAEGGLTVALDTELTDELMDEGFAREMINKVQFMRKEAGFEVVDRIRVYYEAGSRLTEAVERFADKVKAETLAESIAVGPEKGELDRVWDVNGEEARIAVERVK
ncbi:MAG: isoleucine--tRNA ligase [Candidatus Eisenbacteria bacterium]|nr:isoleucine--tRNA ligase [Candidatus Eisenbacteria bacterium]